MTDGISKEEKEFEENQKVLKETIGTRLRGGELCVFIGAGVSVGVVSPWVAFVDECISKTGVQLQRKMWNSRDWDGLKDVYDMCVKLDSDAVAEGLNEALRDSETVGRRTVKHLCALPNVRLYVTTNFDHSLYEELQDSNGAVPAKKYKKQTLANSLSLKEERSAYFIHGYREEETPWKAKHLVDDIVLGRISFDSAYRLAPKDQDSGFGPSEDGPVSSFIQDLLDNHVVLFLGFNPAERYFREVVEPMKLKGRHYIVLPRLSKDHLRKRYNQDSAADYDSLDAGLRNSFVQEQTESKQAKVAKSLGFQVCYYDLEFGDSKHTKFNQMVRDWSKGPGGAPFPTFEPPEPEKLEVRGKGF